jgi:hypothetical protein
MKQNYMQPATEVAEVKTAGLMQAASPAGAPGVNASREGYGTGSSEIWD